MNDWLEEKRMPYDYREKKIVIVLNAKLEMGVALNVAAHLSMALGFHATEHMGRSILMDASGNEHLGISKYPIIITKVRAGKLKSSLAEAKMIEELLVVDYPSVMYTTGHDDELVQELQKQTEEEIEYFGYILFGESDAVDNISGKFSLWK